MWQALGVTGTYLGDYFGILMDKMVTGFPFNILDNPMYIGSTMCFLAHSLWYAHSFLHLPRLPSSSSSSSVSAKRVV